MARRESRSFGDMSMNRAGSSPSTLKVLVRDRGISVQVTTYCLGFIPAGLVWRSLLLNFLSRFHSCCRIFLHPQLSCAVLWSSLKMTSCSLFLGHFFAGSFFRVFPVFVCSVLRAQNQTSMVFTLSPSHEKFPYSYLYLFMYPRQFSRFDFNCRKTYVR